MNARQRKKVRETIVAELQKHGIAAAAYKAAGLSRAQYYRWLKDDREFALEVEEAAAVGTRESNDLARSRLLQKVDQGEAWAIRFQLSRRDPAYRLPQPAADLLTALRDGQLAENTKLLRKIVGIEPRE